MFNCPKCKKNSVRVLVKMLLDIPIDYYAKLSKKALRNKEIEIEGVNWENARFYCSNCSWTDYRG